MDAQNFEPEDEQLDRAIADRLHKLRSMPIDTSGLERMLGSQIPTQRPLRFVQPLRWFHPMRTRCEHRGDRSACRLAGDHIGRSSAGIGNGNGAVPQRSGLRAGSGYACRFSRRGQQNHCRTVGAVPAGSEYARRSRDGMLHAVGEEQEDGVRAAQRKWRACHHDRRKRI